MERLEAISKIEELVGKDLRVLADKYNVTVFTPEGKKNKGWAGHVIERHLGLALNSSRSPNFGSWELKVVPLKRSKSGVVSVKETMAVTMIDPVEVAEKEFEESHVFHKLFKMVVVSRVWESTAETSSLCYAVASFDLGRGQMYDLLKQDYDLIRQTIKEQGFSALSGRMGQLMQPRTKGAGHGSDSRAFYLRSQLVAHILNMAPHPLFLSVAPDEANEKEEIA